MDFVSRWVQFWTDAGIRYELNYRSFDLPAGSFCPGFYLPEFDEPSPTRAAASLFEETA